MRRPMDVLYKSLRVLITVLMMVLVVPVAMQILSRYTGLIPRYIWTEEIARFCFVWIVMIGSMIAVRDGTHFDVDILPHGRSVALERFSKLFVHIAMLLAALTFVVWGWDFAVLGSRQRSEIAGLPMLAIYIAWPVAGLVWILFRIPPSEIERARQAILRQQVLGLIDTKLLYADFRRNVPAENLPKIEENLNEPFEEHEIPRLIKMLEVEDRLALVNKLESLESSLTDVHRQFNERTIAGEWLRQKAPKPKSVTHEQMLEYYQSHLTDFDFPSEAKWEEIAIRFDKVEGGREAAWKQIAELGNEIWQRVSKHPGLRGPIFTEIAKQKSHGFTAHEGGQHDWTTKGALRSEVINEALFSLKVGQLSNILETDTGFHIVRVLDRKQAGRTPFTEAQADIRKQLESGGTQELVKKELEKLRKHCQIWTVFDGNISGPRLGEIMQQRQRR